MSSLDPPVGCFDRAVQSRCFDGSQSQLWVSIGGYAHRRAVNALLQVVPRNGAPFVATVRDIDNLPTNLTKNG